MFRSLAVLMVATTACFPRPASATNACQGGDGFRPDSVESNVGILFAAYLGQVAPQPTLVFYVDRVRSGTSLLELGAHFWGSVEVQAAFFGLSPAATVDKFLLQTFGSSTPGQVSPASRDAFIARIESDPASVPTVFDEIYRLLDCKVYRNGFET